METQGIKRADLRSSCPINFSLELLGDTWSLLILRDIIYFGKRTFNEFLASDEHVAPNILTSRLRQLQANGILIKQPHPQDKRKEIYQLTEDGLDLIPILLELASWGANHIPRKLLPNEWLSIAENHKAEILPIIRRIVRDGGSILVGDDSVISMWRLEVTAHALISLKEES